VGCPAEWLQAAPTTQIQQTQMSAVGDAPLRWAGAADLWSSVAQTLCDGARAAHVRRPAVFELVAQRRGCWPQLQAARQSRPCCNEPHGWTAALLAGSHSLIANMVAATIAQHPAHD
jgi:hypothetical protein